MCCRLVGGGPNGVPRAVLGSDSLPRDQRPHHRDSTDVPHQIPESGHHWYAFNPCIPFPARIGLLSAQEGKICTAHACPHSELAVVLGAKLAHTV